MKMNFLKSGSRNGLNGSKKNIKKRKKEGEKKRKKEWCYGNSGERNTGNDLNTPENFPAKSKKLKRAAFFLVQNGVCLKFKKKKMKRVHLNLYKETKKNGKGNKIL